MYEQIMAALEDALKAKETEIKYWRDRNAVLAGENEETPVTLEQVEKLLEKHTSGKEEENGGGADPYWQPRC